MAAKRYRDIKKEFPIDEGKLVADKNTILKTILGKIEKMVSKELTKNQEKGLALMNTLGAFVNHKVSDKKQEKGKLFLKFGDIEEGVKYTNVHNKIKKIRNLKRKESEFIANIDPAVLGKVVKALAPMFEETEIQEDAATDAANLKAKQTEEMERLKDKQQTEMEALKDRHEREMDRINDQKEKEAANKQIESEREAARKAATSEEVKEDKEEQDRDVSKNKGTQPKKYYKGLDKETKQKRDAHFKAKKSGPAPGDEDEDGEKVKTKKSTHTKKFQQMYGEKLDKNADAGDYIKDFRKSDAPQFKGKSDKKIQKMAVAAFLSKKEK